MTKRLKHIALTVCLFIWLPLFSIAQDTSKIYFTTAVGMLHPVSVFSKAYKNSLALNSGVEYKFYKNFFAQFVLDFNAINYNQQIKDAGSTYLFQNTSSSVFLAGINAGYNVSLIRSGRLFTSPYVGAGYANIGEPRLTVDGDIINQRVVRMKGLFTRFGTRLAYNTGSKVLQTVYADASYWSANINVQNSRPRAFSFLIGTRFGF